MKRKNYGKASTTIPNQSFHDMSNTLNNSFQLLEIEMKNSIVLKRRSDELYKLILDLFLIRLP